MTRFLTLLLLLVPCSSAQWALEGGAFFNPYFSLSDGERADAARDWKLGARPVIRLERWWRSDQRWEFGFTALPFYFQTTQLLAEPLRINGEEFAQNSEIRFRYQFHSLRGTAAYRIRESSRSTLRLGVSLIGRFAELRAEQNGRVGRDTNLIAFPLAHVSYKRTLSSQSDFVLRGDILPFSPREGLYDVFVGVEGRGDRGFTPRLGGGFRLFWGGFSPRESGQNNNEIFFWGPVLRLRL